MFLIAFLSLWSIFQNLDIMEAFQQAKKKESIFLRYKSLIKYAKFTHSPLLSLNASSFSSKLESLHSELSQTKRSQEARTYNESFLFIDSNTTTA